MAVLFKIREATKCSLDWLLFEDTNGQTKNLPQKSNVIPLPHRVEFNETEWALISEAAEVAGQSPDEWVKDQLNEHYGTVQAGHLIERKRTYYEVLDEMVGEMVERRLKRG